MPRPNPHAHDPDDWDEKLDGLEEARKQLIQAALSQTIDEIEDEDDLWEAMLYDQTVTLELDTGLFLHMMSMAEQHLHQPMESMMALLTVEVILSLADQGEEEIREHIEDYYGADLDPDRGIY